MIQTYDRSGHPITQMAFYDLITRDDYKRVALDRVGDVEVSTIWLGIDHGWGTAARPLIFETMVFGGERLDGVAERYATIEEARAGHTRMIERVRAASEVAR